MKKNYLLVVLLIATQLSFSQIVNIPDTNFKNALINLTVADFNGDTILDGDADTNDDGEIDVTEANAILGLDVNFRFINTLEGIASFSNLQWLNCSINNLTALDVSQNVNLIDLDCRSNDIISLDVSQLTSLNELNVNFNELTTLTLGSNSNLERIFCADNDLTSINVSQIPNLKRLSASFNLFQSINVSNNLLLEDLFLQGNQIQTIDLSQNSNLDWLDITSNGLLFLDTSNNPLLETLSCAFNNLTFLDLSTNSNLTSIFTRANLLTGLDIQNGANTILTTFNTIENPNLTCINVDDVTYAQSQATWQKDAIANYDTNCPTLSTKEFQETVHITMYPNPTIGKLQIASRQTLSQVIVYNLVGQQVKAITMQPNQNAIDISELKTGSYFVNVQSTAGNTYTKLIVKK